MHDALADETAVRDLLDLIATDPPPPSGVDVGLARRQGRRRRRLRRVWLPGAAPVAAAAAVAVIASVTAGLSGTQPSAHRPPASDRGRGAPMTAPHQFSLLTPYASFGWLPAGFSLGDQYDQSASELDVTATAPASDGRALLLRAAAAGQCRLTISEALTFVRTRDKFQHALHKFRHALSCGQPLTARAPDINGRPAYWTLDGSLAWEYGRDAWATLSPIPNPGICVHCAAYPYLKGWYHVVPKHGHPAVLQSATARRLLHKIASAVRFGTKPTVYSGFRLSGLPATWRPLQAGSLSSFATIDGKLVNEGWSAGPAVDPTALGVSVWPTGQSSVPCKVYAGQTSYVTVDGVLMRLRTINEPDKHVQSLCAQNFRGLGVFISLDRNVPGTNDRSLPDAAKVGGVLTVFRHLHLFGPDVANWPVQQP
jgi:hypothetical protein